jgi:hypothetical protein
VAFDGTNYLVVWDHQNNIHGTRVSISGIPIEVDPTWITSGYTSQNPSMAFGGGYYLVAWEEGMDLFFSDIHARRIKTDGETADPIAIEITSSASASNPSIAFDGANYLVTWNDNGIYAAQVDTQGTVLGAKGIPLCSNPEARNADVAYDGANHLVIWEEGVPESFFDICGAKVSPAGEKIDSFDISTRAENQIRPALTKGPEEEVLIVYSGLTDSVDGRSANAMRIWGSFYRFTGVEEELDPKSRIARFELMQNYPNPFNSSTSIRYVLARRTRLEVTVYNVLGHMVKRLFSGEQQRGTHILKWDGRDDRGKDVGSGIYFYRLKTAQGAREIRKMLFLK